jgi:hypothetical protein
MKFLAFKGVNRDLQSAWVSGGLRIQYKSGRVFKTYAPLAMYLIPAQQVNSEEAWEEIRVGASIPRILLVEVEQKDLQWGIPFVTNANVTEHTPKDFADLYLKQKISPYKDMGNDPNEVGATRLKVLHEVDKTLYNNPRVAMRSYEKLYGLKQIPHDNNSKI